MADQEGQQLEALGQPGTDLAAIDDSHAAELDHLDGGRHDCPERIPRTASPRPSRATVSRALLQVQAAGEHVGESASALSR